MGSLLSPLAGGYLAPEVYRVCRAKHRPLSCDYFPGAFPIFLGSLRWVVLMIPKTRYLYVDEYCSKLNRFRLYSGHIYCVDFLATGVKIPIHDKFKTISLLCVSLSRETNSCDLGISKMCFKYRIWIVALGVGKSVHAYIPTGWPRPSKYDSSVNRRDACRDVWKGRM